MSVVCVAGEKLIEVQRKIFKRFNISRDSDAGSINVFAVSGVNDSHAHTADYDYRIVEIKLFSIGRGHAVI